VIVESVELVERDSHPNCGSDHSQYLRGGGQKKPKSKPLSWIVFSAVLGLYKIFCKTQASMIMLPWTFMYEFWYACKTLMQWKMVLGEKMLSSEQAAGAS
jgi:hypothetical protein